MFEVSTIREEKAYRLGYYEGCVYMLQMISVLMSPLPKEPYSALRAYTVNVLAPWVNEESPEIYERTPRFSIS
jgi:hypothetical protein